MKVYVVITSYQHGLGEAVETDAEVFDTRDKARKAMERKGLNTLEIYKHSLDCDDFQISVSDSFYHISDNEGETWDNFDIVERKTMKKKTIKEVIDTLYLKYKCIDNEDIWVEITDKYICINWNSYMSSFVSMLRVKQIASYLRKFTSLPIYDAYCNVY